MTDLQPSKNEKLKNFPSFVSKDPPTALRSVSEIYVSSKRYMQGDKSH